MRPSRRGLLHVCGVGLATGVAGCLSLGSGTESSTSIPTETGVSTSTTDGVFTPPTPKDCPDEPRVPDPEPHPDGADMPPIPEPPTSVDDEQAVEEYVSTYERAYQWRKWTRTYEPPIVSVSIEAIPKVRKTSDEGAIVAFQSMAYGRIDYESDDPTATGETDAPGHFDGSPYTVAYLVTDQAVWRDQAGVEADPAELDPYEDGTLLECF